MTHSVLFFDSGVGGLSVLEQVHQRCSPFNLRYVMDDAAFPYGTKTDEALSQRVLQVCQQAVQQFSPDLLVIACNTASTLTLPLLRQCLTIPVIGVVPAIKPAAQQTLSGHIGLLATPATVERLYIEDLIQDFAGHCTVSRLGSRELVEWAEQLLRDGIINPALRSHLQPWFDSNPKMSHVVLGCTHFPLLKPHFETLWPHIHWIDSGEAIARRVSELMPANHNSSARTLALHWTSAASEQPGAERFLRRLGSLGECRPMVLEQPIVIQKENIV